MSGPVNYLTEYHVNRYGRIDRYDGNVTHVAVPIADFDGNVYTEVQGIEWCIVHQGIADECNDGELCDMRGDGEPCDLHVLYVMGDRS